MSKLTNMSILATSLMAMLALNTANADEVKIIAADFHNLVGNQWSVNVTLKHDDRGWDHYADNWRIVDREGNILGDRVLRHPHVKEQPFTRSLSSVKIPVGITTVYIEAHDKVHGWTPGRLKVNLSKTKNGRLRVRSE